MTSGIQDYDVLLNLNATLHDPKWDITPQDFLALENTTFTCNPGIESRGALKPCIRPSYVSINYQLLVMMLAHYAGVETWESYDQFSVLRDSKIREKLSHGVTWFKHGLCSDYRDVVHFYMPSDPFNHTINRTVQHEDMYDTSCLNGWGFGNIGSTAHAAASFFYELMAGRSVLSQQSVEEMKEFAQVPLWDKGTWYVQYGLGLMNMWIQGFPRDVVHKYPGIQPYTMFIGHYGDDYGTNTHNGFHPELGAGISIMLNKKGGVNGSDTHEYPMCQVWKAIFKVVGEFGAAPMSPIPGGSEAFDCVMYPTGPW